jgi:hypothetical protein
VKNIILKVKKLANLPIHLIFNLKPTIMERTYYATRQVSESEKNGIKRMKRRVKDFKNETIRIHSLDENKVLHVLSQSSRSPRIK